MVDSPWLFLEKMAMDHRLWSCDRLRKQIPQNNPGRYYYIKGMFCAELGYFYTGIDHAHDLIANAVYFVTKYQCILFAGCYSKILQHDAFFGLFNCDYLITICPQLANGLHRVVKIFPVNRLRSAKGGFFNFAMRGLGRYAAKINFFDSKAICRTEN